MEVNFVPFDRVFLEASWHWLQDEELRKLIAAAPITREDQERWFAQLPQRTDYLIWGVLAKHEPIGVCGIKHLVSGSGEYWGYIGEKAYWGKGVGKQMLQFTEDAAKNIGLTALTLQVVIHNERAVKLYLKYGYTIDAELPDKYKMVKRLQHD